jgi:NAD(P)-dependent dehydrogenase (short-subunit alcohol dehydrogenase family)
MELDLAGKRAIITGGGTGIGFAIARELAKEKVSVVISSRRGEVLESAASRIRDEVGVDVVTVVADTGNDASVKSMVATVRGQLGGVDILVNNAAEQPAQQGPSYTDATDEWFLRQLNVKVLGYLRTSRAVAPLMMENQWGRIINISGTGARQTVSLIGSVRNVSIAAMTKNLADELGEHGINVTVVHPGATRTERFMEFQQQAGLDPDASVRAAGHASVIGRVVEPHEVAWVVAFLASPRSVSISGDAVVVGGGIPGFIYY